MSLPSYFVTVVPILTAIISGWLCSDDFGDGVNALISLITLLVTTWLWSLLGTAVIASQAGNAMIVIAFSLALITPVTPLYTLRQWLMTHTRSPFSTLPTITISVAQPGVAQPGQRSTLPSRAAQRWATDPPTTWQPSTEESTIHHEDTASIPVVSLQPPITLRPSSQKGINHYS